MADKDRELLEERIKRSSKNRPSTAPAVNQKATAPSRGPTNSAPNGDKKAARFQQATRYILEFSLSYSVHSVICQSVRAHARTSVFLCVCVCACAYNCTYVCVFGYVQVCARLFHHSCLYLFSCFTKLLPPPLKQTNKQTNNTCMKNKKRLLALPTNLLCLVTVKSEFKAYQILLTYLGDRDVFLLSEASGTEFVALLLSWNNLTTREFVWCVFLLNCSELQIGCVGYFCFRQRLFSPQTSYCSFQETRERSSRVRFRFWHNRGW